MISRQGPDCIRHVVLLLIGGMFLLLLSGCGDTRRQGSADQGTTSISAKTDAFPKKASVGQIYHDPADGKEWIFDGVQWVPHDETVDAYYAQLEKEQTIKRTMLLSAAVYTTGACGDGTGAHAKHANVACSTCHLVGGAMCFDPNGPAVAPGKPLPSFDTTTKTCSNISCHGMYSGTYTYVVWDYGCDCPTYQTVNYAGAGGTTPSWYSPPGAIGCTACHNNPPPTGNWHSLYHANPTGGSSNDYLYSNCELCHNDPTISSPNTPIAIGVNGVGTAIVTPAQHGNGVVTVYARWTWNPCFSCH